MQCKRIKNRLLFAGVYPVNLVYIRQRIKLWVKVIIFTNSRVQIAVPKQLNCTKTPNFLK